MSLHQLNKKNKINILKIQATYYMFLKFNFAKLQSDLGRKKNQFSIDVSLLKNNIIISNICVLFRARGQFKPKFSSDLMNLAPS